MQLHWWMTAAFAGAIWVAGWFVSAASFFIFDPLTSPEKKREDWWGRLVAACVTNWILWPWLLPAFWRRYRFYQDMKTGRRPNWLVLADGEASGQKWILSDGTECGAHVYSDTPKRPSRIEAFYVNHRITGLVEYRISKIAPAEEGFTDWCSMVPDNTDNSNDEDGFSDYASKYEKSVELSRGKYRAAFRFQNRVGKMEEKSGVTFIIADDEDYADA